MALKIERELDKDTTILSLYVNSSQLRKRR